MPVVCMRRSISRRWSVQVWWPRPREPEWSTAFDSPFGDLSRLRAAQNASVLGELDVLVPTHPVGNRIARSLDEDVGDVLAPHGHRTLAAHAPGNASAECVDQLSHTVPGLTDL